MGKAYSLDLRKKVLNFIKKGHSKKKASEIFGITARTIFNWSKRQEEGKLQASKNTNRKPKKIDPKELQKFIEEHPEMTILQIANHFGVWYQTIYYRIQKLGFVYKKKPSYTRKKTRSSEKFSNN
jgi:transposase